jgi:phosphatidylglycerophosphatase A
VRRPDGPPARPLAAIVCSTVLGIGYAPIAPGTFGSAAGLALWFVIADSVALQTAAIAITLVIGIWSATAVATHFGSHDPSEAVIDEVLGILVTLFLIPVGWGTALGGLLLFRVLDIVKPFPARRFERFPGGLGVMADDAMAGVYANVGLRGILWMVSA